MTTNRESEASENQAMPLFNAIPSESIEEEGGDEIELPKSDESDSPLGNNILTRSSDIREKSKKPYQDNNNNIQIGYDNITKPSLRILVNLVQRNSLKELDSIMGVSRADRLNLTPPK